MKNDATPSESNSQIDVSFCPKGESFSLPTTPQYESEYKRLEMLANEHRNKGREVVVVMGVGFVGAVMAGVVADAVSDAGHPNYFVIGMQRPSTRSYWKIPYLNRGLHRLKLKIPKSRP